MRRLKDLSQEEKEQAKVEAMNKTLEKLPFMAKFPFMEKLMTEISNIISRNLGESEGTSITNENKEDKIE